MLKIKGVKDTEKNINFMTDLDVDFVSFVQHGANKEPFRVIKTVKGGTMDKLAVQSLVLANGVELDSLVEKDGLGWLSEVSAENVEKKDAYSKITQIDTSQFDEQTLQLLKLDAAGAWAIVGKMKDDADADQAVTISEKQVKEFKENEQKSVFQQPVTDDKLTGGWAIPAITAGDLFREELWNMEDVLFSIMRQENLDMKKRKRAVLDSVEAFKGFVSMLLDSVGEGDIKINKTRNDKKGGTDMALFESQEEFEKAVDERVKAALEQKAEEKTDEPDTKTDESDQKTDEKQAEPDTSQKADESEQKADEKSDDQKADAQKSDDPPAWASELHNTIKSLGERIDKMENQPDGEAANDQDTDTGGTVAKSNDNAEDDKFDHEIDDSINPKYRGAFSGLFGDLRG